MNATDFSLTSGFFSGRDGTADALKEVKRNDRIDKKQTNNPRKGHKNWRTGK
jgi:hypothetical protein